MRGGEVPPSLSSALALERMVGDRLQCLESSNPMVVPLLKLARRSHDLVLRELEAWADVLENSEGEE